MSWFECKVTYQKEINHSGKVRKISENYLVDAVSFADAETRIVEEMKGRGGFIMVSVSKVSLYDLFLDSGSQHFYKCKLGLISFDELRGTDNKKYVQIIVQADNIDLALKSLHENMEKTLVEYEVASITETAYLDVFEYKNVNQYEVERQIMS